MNNTTKQKEFHINKEKVTKIALTAGGALGLLGLGYFLGSKYCDKARPIRTGYVEVVHDLDDNSWNLLVYRNKKRSDKNSPSRHIWASDIEVLEAVLSDSMEVLKKMKGEE